MLKNKIYISGLNMTGKSFLSSLLNGNPSIACYPFHKFGLSLEYNKFKNYLVERTTRHIFNKKFFESSEKKTIKVKLYNEKKIYKINISELALFIIKNNGSIPLLFEAHYSKKYPIFSGDTNYEFRNIDFNFNTFINSIEKNIDLYQQEVFELEDLDNIIFNSFLNSTDQYESNLQQYKYYCQCTSNSLNEINFLLDNYKNSKLIYIKRDLVSSSYSVAKRLIAKNNGLISKNNIKKFIFNYAESRKINEDIYLNSIKNYSLKSNLLIINFNDLFSRRKDIMYNICDFLNIKFKESMMIPHELSTKINNSDFHQKNMSDDPNELFSEKELNEIKNILNSKTKLFFYKYLYRVLLKINLIK